MTPSLVLDFDGTTTLRDMGDAICDRFAPPQWRDFDEEWHRGETSLDAAQRKMWGLARATRSELGAATRELGVLRPGFSDLLDRADAAGVVLVLASGGFDVFIQALIGEHLDRFEATFFNRLCVDGNRLIPEFPWRDELGCGACVVCKGLVCDRQRPGPVIFAGDGSSDRCAIGRADRLYAVRGSRLHALALERGAAVEPFDTFDEIAL